MARPRIVTLALFVFAVPAAAHRFEAKMVAQPREAELVSSDMGWTCAGGVCAADGAMSDAPARICAHVARELGKVEAFTVDAQPLDADKLAKCNAKAK